MKQEQACLLIVTWVYIIMEMGNLNVISVTIECYMRGGSHEFDVKCQFDSHQKK